MRQMRWKGESMERRTTVKEPKKIEVTLVSKVTYDIEDNSIMPKRTIEEYWTLDGRKIGVIDPLDQFSLIND